MRGSTERRAIVASVSERDGKLWVQMIDAATSSPFEVPHSVPGGMAPIPGDYWVCDNSYGFWALRSIITPRQTMTKPQRTFREIIALLRDRFIIDPSFADAEHREAPHLAYIGEVRWFGFVPDPYYWLPVEGQAVNRVKYRELAAVIDPGGTTENFTMPDDVDGYGSVLPYMCAR